MDDDNVVEICILMELHKKHLNFLKRALNDYFSNCEALSFLKER